MSPTVLVGQRALRVVVALLVILIMIDLLVLIPPIPFVLKSHIGLEAIFVDAQGGHETSRTNLAIVLLCVEIGIEISTI